MADITAVEGDTAVNVAWDLEDAYGPISLALRTITYNQAGATTSTTTDNAVTGQGHLTLSSTNVGSQGHFHANFQVTRVSTDQFFPSNRDLTVLILPHTRAR